MSGSGAKKGAAPAKGKAEAPKKKVWGPQDDAARKIQTYYRRHLAKKDLAKKKKEKEEYNELMDKLEKEVSSVNFKSVSLFSTIYIHILIELHCIFIIYDNNKMKCII